MHKLKSEDYKTTVLTILPQKTRRSYPRIDQADMIHLLEKPCLNHKEQLAIAALNLLEKMKTLERECKNLRRNVLLLLTTSKNFKGEGRTTLLMILS